MKCPRSRGHSLASTRRQAPGARAASATIGIREPASASSSSSGAVVVRARQQAPLGDRAGAAQRLRSAGAAEPRRRSCLLATPTRQASATIDQAPTSSERAAGEIV